MKAMRNLRSLATITLAATLAMGLAYAGESTAPAAQGTMEKIRVSAPSLAGNQQGNDSVRDVHIYLPPGYAKGNQRYPVI